MSTERRSSDDRRCPPGGDDLDPFADEPITPPGPVGVLHVFVPAAATTMLGLGLTGLVTTLSTRPSGPNWVLPEAFGPSMFVNLVHLAVGSVGLVLSRYPVRARAFATIAGAGYLALGPVQLLASTSESGEVLVVRRELVSVAMSMSDIGPLLCFALGVALIMLRVSVDELGTGG